MIFFLTPTVVFGIGGRDVLNSAPSFCNSTLASGYAILAAVSSSGKSCLNRLKAVLPPNISCKSFQSIKSGFFCGIRQRRWVIQR